MDLTESAEVSSIPRPKRGADVVFLFDLTSISPPCLERLCAGVDNKTAEFVESGSAHIPGALGVPDLRYKVCGYHQIDPGSGDAWWVDRPFTTSLEQFKADLDFVIQACRASPAMQAGIAADESLVIRLDGNKCTSVSIDSILGKPHFKSQHADAQFLSDQQFELKKSGGIWHIAPCAGATNETLVGGVALVASTPVHIGMRVGVGNAAKGIEKLPLIIESSGMAERPTPLLDALWKLSHLPTAEIGVDADSSQWRYRRDAERSVVVFSGAPCRMVTLEEAASGATFDDVENSIMNMRLVMTLCVPACDESDFLCSIDRCRWDSTDTVWNPNGFCTPERWIPEPIDVDAPCPPFPLL